MEMLIGDECLDCGSPWVLNDLACGVCIGRAYRYAHVDSSDAELLTLRWRASEQRKQREAKKWQAALDAAVGIDY